jgi:hypothetical protein
MRPHSPFRKQRAQFRCNSPRAAGPRAVDARVGRPKEELVTVYLRARPARSAGTTVQKINTPVYQAITE